jgi:hypothetical protein
MVEVKRNSAGPEIGGHILEDRSGPRNPPCALIVPAVVRTP